MGWCTQSWWVRKPSTKNSITRKLFFKIKGEIRSLLNKQKQREFVISIPEIQDILKEGWNGRTQDSNLYSHE